MAFLKVGACLALGYLLFIRIEGHTMILTYAMMVYLFVLNKNPNIRVLVAILAVHIFVLYEGLYFAYYLTKDVLETGKLIGDITSNLFRLLSYFGLLIAIYYREELTRLVYRDASYSYMPTKADIVQIIITKILLAFTVVYSVFFIYFAIQHITNLDTDPEVAKYWYDLFSRYVLSYRDYGSNLGTIKLLTFSLLLISWSSERSGDKKPTYSGVIK